MIAPAEVHHAVPQCLLRLHPVALNGDGVEASIEFTLECERWRVPVEIDRADLQALVEASTVVLDREKHRLIHQSDFQRWGRRGGLATLRRYGSDWYSALALKRWGRLADEDLAAMRPIQ